MNGDNGQESFDMKMQSKFRHHLTISLILLIAAASAKAGEGSWNDLMRGSEVIIEHSPTHVGGPASDTAFELFGEQSSQRLADEVVLKTPAHIGIVSWWGFYDDDNPPSTEIFRVRFYGASASDELPNEADIVYEATLNEAGRIATGQHVAVGIGPAEYRYEHSLSSPLFLSANSLYWLEIIQIDDLSTTFRWEFGANPFISGHAFTNPVVGDWRHTTNTISDQAFQLIAVPEPGTAASFVLASIIFLTFKRRRV